ncbi:MAG: methenyltetrahydrofolate cyclohydrolase [Cyanobacteria bacterium RYN_339]|nr:methenyltetrahydrofolate cyclohydrolase [Cyanobacteria bacterium RYN_339]
MSFTDLPAHQLLERFAANDPTPGGGSASAFAGSLAAALARMVAGLTVGKKGYEEASQEAAKLGQQAEGLQGKLARAVAEDAASFEAVMTAMALPKATDEEKEARKLAMQAGLKGATLAPMGVAQACLDTARLAHRLLGIGNKNACTDAAVAVLLACAGAEGALLNAAINLGSIKDEAWVEEQREQCDALWEALDAMRSDLWPQVRAHGLDIAR